MGEPRLAAVPVGVSVHLAGMSPSAEGSGSAPLIGVPGRRCRAESVQGLLATMAQMDVEIYFRDYASAVAEAGGLPVLLSLETHPQQIVERLDGIVLPGGTDVNPALYGAEADAALLDIEPERDAFELALLEEAAAAEVPVLAICRGLQMVNVWRGGTLHQHVPNHGRFEEPPDRLQHEVVLTQGSLLEQVYGTSLMVNSLHHQTVDQLGAGLRITGEAPDGTIEGIETADASVVAVQWHPELLPQPDPIFGWFVTHTASS